MSWLPGRPTIGDRVRISETARAIADAPLPQGAGTVTKVHTAQELFAAQFRNANPARVEIAWDDPNLPDGFGAVRPERTWRVGDLDPE